jgi:hypothetical protein
MNVKAVDAKAAAQNEVSRAGRALVELSHTVHAHPELAFEEERAAAWVADALSGPFSIESGVCDLPPRSWRPQGPGPFTVAICARYDAPAVGRSRMRPQRDRRGGGRCRTSPFAPIADELGITVKVIRHAGRGAQWRQDPHAAAGAFAGVRR